MIKISKEIKVGFVVLLVIAAFYWGFNFLKGRDIFKKNKEYYVVYNRIEGLKESNIVSINGFQVGVVKAIKFDIMNPRNLLVCIAIDYKVRVPKNTVARIENIDLLGTVGIELILSPSLEILKNHDTLVGDNELTLNEQIAPLKIKMEHLFVSFDSTIGNFRKTLDESTISNVKKSIENIQLITWEFVQQRKKIDIVLDQLVSVSGNEKLSKAINNFYDISDSLKKTKITSSLVTLNQMLKNGDDIMQKINKGKGTAAMLVNQDSLYTQLQQTNHDLDSLIKDIHQNPKKYVNFSIFQRKK